ncbi:bifunctional phosphoribosylaminoimidazolecarboxamide formyltransferase/IMP cyclohydrolase [Lacipirellula parvula]|uniref:Bifunctional purine biosynthesis protein PurH n=1 Tax=Lacipirellula parvula TaxID=2650471 RepID=A0A5K7X4A5_9BACT|nr:bifunctional phosphoribosylaminoimidazolecarboxamide formyltransferase/IMP cyclohydrolase [Lacipirellula parvula]BBO30642.1 IMP cyclohydrolase [Lacipirellula parvula]
MSLSPPIKRALISVSDKTGLLDFARSLVTCGVELFSTGGTRKHLADAGLPVRDVADYTGFPEMMDGRVKTLHPKVHGGILCRHDHPEDMKSLADHGILSFELVVVNLYPFEKTVANPDVAIEAAIEQIDIGGPSMVRSAAKNHAFVTLATDASQYETILQQIETHGRTTPELRRQLAGAAFARTSQYDTAIAAYFAKILGSSPLPLPPSPGTDHRSPVTSADAVTLHLTHRTPLRYGENPHQSADLYAFADAPSHAFVNAEQLHGKELSYNNLLDLDAALAIAKALPRPAVAVLKHNNPCGAATAATLGEAVAKAWDGDPLSAFGSVLGVNVPVDAAMAEYLSEPGKFIEAIVAPEFHPDAIRILTTKPKWRDNVRLLRVGELPVGHGARQFRQIDGGMLAQNADDLPDEPSEWKVVTQVQPTPELHHELRFAWAACRFVKSNAIVVSNNGALAGVGAGQMSRVDSVEIALKKAGEKARGGVLASDAFFPFDDSIGPAAAAGIAAIIQPGGSRRDEEVIAACNKHGIPMIFTGRRHFRH